MWHSGRHRPSHCRREIRGLEFRQSVLRLRSFLSLLKLVRYRVEIHKLRAAADIFRRSDSDVFSSFSDALLPIKDARSGGEEIQPPRGAQPKPDPQRLAQLRGRVTIPRESTQTVVATQNAKNG